MQTLPAISSDSESLPALPPITDSAAWLVPATSQETRNAAAFLLNVVEPEATNDRAKLMGNMLDNYGYSRAELYHAIREVPRDAEASHNYGRGFSLADVHRVVTRHRDLRSKLTRKLTDREVGEILDAHGHEGLTAAHFPQCGFGTGRDADTPLYKYSPNPITAGPVEPITEPTGERSEPDPMPFVRHE